MGKTIRELAIKNKINFYELKEFAKKNGKQYDYWEINREATVEKPRGIIQNFNSFKIEKIREKAEVICDQMTISKNRLVVYFDEYVEIKGFSKICTLEGYRYCETISLMKMIGYERKFKENPDIFWNVMK